MRNALLPVAARSLVFVLATAAVSASCRRTAPQAGDGGVGAPPPAAPAEVTADEQAAWQVARPVFAEYCMKCHTSTGSSADATALSHLSFDNYPPDGMHGPEAGSAVRTVLGLTGQPATMPADRPGAVVGNDLERVNAWTEAFDKGRRAPADHLLPQHAH